MTTQTAWPCLIATIAAALFAPQMAYGQDTPVAADDSAAAIIMYHRFGEDRYPSTNIRIEQLEAHIRELRDGPYSVLLLPEIVDAWQRGTPLPDRAVAITVDDAYASFAAEGWPRFRAAGLPVTLFVATEAVDQDLGGVLSWDELRRLRDDGVTIGHHSHTHLHMPTRYPESVESDLVAATRLFEAELGERPRLFAYPYGEFGGTERSVVERQGFDAAFGQQSGTAHAGMDRLTLPRYALNESYGAPDRFRLVVNALPLPVADVDPIDPILTSAGPPQLAFSVMESVGSLDRLSCFASGQGRVEATVAPTGRVTVLPVDAFPKGRSRINCTLPTDSGRWRWFGVQFLRIQ